jgi:hypothetical protein
MAGSVSIWKIFGFPKVSLYLERFVLKHATAHIHKRWQTFWTNLEVFMSIRLTEIK